MKKEIICSYYCETCKKKSVTMMMMITRVPTEHFYSHSFQLTSKPNAYVWSLP